MKYLKSKIRQLNKHIDEVAKNVVVDGVTANLTNLVVTDSSELVVGQAYSCTIAPSDGFYLPSVISVTGTASTYGFKYDHTTGVIYIPSDEVIGDIVITAEASDVNWNVPAQFEVRKITSDVYHTDYLHEQQHFIMFTVTPSRGSTVSVTYGGLTKTVTGDLTTDAYDSSPIEVFFGTYHSGATDEVETPDSGIVTISGAYESFDLVARFEINSDKDETSALILKKVIDIGAPRYLDGHSIWSPYSAEESNIVFNTPLGIRSSGDVENSAFGCNGTITYNKMPYGYSGTEVGSTNGDVGIIMYANDMNPAEETGNTIWYDNGRIHTAHYNDVDFGKWLESYRKNYITDSDGAALTVYINEENVYDKEQLIVPDNCERLERGSFYGFDKVSSIEISKSVKDIYNDYGLFVKEYEIMYAEYIMQQYPDVSEEEAMLLAKDYIDGMFLDLFVGDNGQNIPFVPLPSCTSLAVASENEVYYSENNCVITKDGTKVLIVGIDSNSIPSDIKEIGGSAFAVTASTTVNYPQELIKIGDFAFYYCPYLNDTFSVPNSVKYIGKAAYMNPININGFESGNITSLEECSGLTGTLTIPDGIECIDSWAFAGNALLNGTLVIPDGITEIKTGSFAYTGFTSAVIPENVTTIGSQAFQKCYFLTNINLPNSIVNIGSSAFANSALTGDIVIPSGVTSVSDSVFSGCTGLTSVVIPEGVTFIGNSAFSGCTGLTSVVIPEGVTFIGNSAFSGCTGLTSVVIPSTVTQMDNYVFDKVVNVTILATTPPTISKKIFTSGTIASITVPAGTSAAYKAAENWSAFADIIVEAT